MEKCETIVEGGMAVPVHLTKCSLKWFRKESLCTRSRRDCADGTFRDDISLSDDMFKLSCMEAADKHELQPFQEILSETIRIAKKKGIVKGLPSS